MSGNSAECRKQAMHCLTLADEARTPEARQRFRGLSQIWIKLAAELESDQVFLDAMGRH